MEPHAKSADGIDDVVRFTAIGAVACGALSLEEGARRAGLSPDQLLRILDRAGREPRDEETPRLSVVLPVCNEIENLPAMLDRLRTTLDPIATFEVIVVDDGSTDGTLELATTSAEADPRIVVLELSRNFGHQRALLAGLHETHGDAVVLMDADGQDPPELLPTLIEKWEAGHDVVYAVRRNRKESWWKRTSYALFYRILYSLAELRIPANAGDFCLMDRRVVDTLNRLPESSQFLRGLRTWVGFRQIGVDYDRPARLEGETKYTFRRLVRLAVDGIFGFSSVPLRLASYLGFLTSLLGLAYLLFAVFARAFFGEVPAGWTSIIAIILLLGGAQLTVIGVLGSYLARVYDETKRRPHYVIARRTRGR